MRVRQLDTRRPRDVQSFIRLPFALYAECPQWVPPLVSDLRLALDRTRYPFYRHSDADFFVAESEGQVLGRIAVLENRPYNRFHKSSAAFFYYFEATQDAQVARALSDAAFAWARGRGLDVVLGPKGLLRGDGQGVLVEGFEHRPATGIPYNLPYYDALLRGCGFEKQLDYLSGHLDKGYQFPERIHQVADQVKRRRGFRVLPLKTKGELMRLAPLVHRIYQEAFVQVWGYYPVEEEEIRALLRRIAYIADPRLIKLVLKDQEAIGFIIAYPDISEALQRTGGRLWPLGWLRLLTEPRRTKWLDFNGLGVLPKYQGAGVNAVMYSELARTFAHGSFRFEHADYAQVAESNLHSLGDAALMGISWYKRHRVYRKDL